MATEQHPLAPDHLPGFIVGSGESDTLMTVMAVVLVGAVFLIGVFYLYLHSLPERRMHGAKKVQFEVVAVLALIALFTHNHLFWIAGLLLAMVPVPDFHAPIQSIADSMSRIADSKRDPVLAPRDAATHPGDDAIS
jgi:hypothetical protein